MKCLCCHQSFEDQFSLKEHYAVSHGVDQNNYLFRKLFTRDVVFAPRQCFHCDYFYLNRRNEKNYNFLEHYQQGSSHPVKDKPIKKIILIKFAEVLYKFSQHSDH